MSKNSAKSIQERIDIINSVFDAGLNMSTDAVDKDGVRPLYGFHYPHPFTGKVIDCVWDTTRISQEIEKWEQCEELVIPTNLRRLSELSMINIRQVRAMKANDEEMAQVRATLNDFSSDWEQSEDWRQRVADLTKYAAGVPMAPESDFTGDDDDDESNDS